MADEQANHNKAYHEFFLRVRYSETDQMGTFYNSRALEWFECARTELLRSLGMPYSQMEAQGVFLPVIEAHLVYKGRAKYDDKLRVVVWAEMTGKARLKAQVKITNADTGNAVVEGYTVHAFIDKNGKVIKPPEWFLKILNNK
jgi:acyl-CoA thioester hydrolase